MPGDDPHSPRADRLEQPAQASQLQVLIEAFAKRLDDDREIGKLAHDLKQILRPQPLQPERGPPGGIRPGHEQRPGRVLAKSQPVKRGLRQLQADQALRLVGGQTLEQVEGRVIHSGQPDQESVVAMQARGLDAVALADAAQQCELQSLVHPAAERGQDRQAEVPGRVAKGLHKDRAIVRHNACNARLAGNMANQGPRRPGLEPALLFEPAG